MRSLEIIRIVHEYFISEKHKKKILGKRIEEACQKLGPVYIKFGQILSTRYDFLSEQDCNELQKLLDNTKQVPYKKIEEIFVHDFGKKPEELFLEFDKKPIASASISQVYRGKLKTGEDVAIKVRRPYIGKNIEKDMNILITLARVSKIFSKDMRLINSTAIAKEMKKWILNEINFRKEQENIIKIKEQYSFCDEKNFKNYFGQGHFPTTYNSYCSDNVITMDYMDGVPLIRSKNIMHNSEYNIRESMRGYFGCTIYALFNSKSFVLQADPHPANMIVMKNGHAANVDCGMVINLNKEELEKINDLFIAVYLRDLKKTTNLILEMCRKNKKYYNKIVPDIKKYLDRTRHEDVAFWFLEPLKISLKHNMRFPEYFTAFGRAVIVFDGTIKYFDKNARTIDMIGDELKDEAKKRMLRNINNINYESVIYNVVEKLKESPETINYVINRYSSNPVRIINDAKLIIDELSE